MIIINNSLKWKRDRRQWIVRRHMCVLQSFEPGVLHSTTFTGLTNSGAIYILQVDHIYTYVDCRLLSLRWTCYEDCI
jgi:hypothetical protein